ncbi:MAG: hypothetical protein MUE52_17820 [Tabrizicola sp.]|jgi:hypothetical protein|nr:hypothetical protein [Tabrizicola sp.]
MSAKGWPWDVLDLPKAPATTAEVRRAYAKKLKTIDQAADITGFEALRKAYEAALHRVEQKVRKAAEKAQPTPASAATPIPDPLADAAPPSDPLPSAPPPSATAPPLPAAPAPDPLQLQSPRDRLQIRLNLLQEKNILLSPQARVQAILDDPEFQSPDLLPQLRFGLAQYIRSQMLENHLGEPYLRHPGVTTELLKTLDARFGWLSDYNAFRRDFWGDARVLEAMIDAAGIDRRPPPVPHIPDTSARGRAVRFFSKTTGWILFIYVLVLKVVVEAHEKSPDNVALNGLKVLMFGILALFMFGLGALLLDVGYRWLRSRLSTTALAAGGGVAFVAFFLVMFALR